MQCVVVGMRRAAMAYEVRACRVWEVSKETQADDHIVVGSRGDGRALGFVVGPHRIHL